jgi:hypothetical protein
MVMTVLHRADDLVILRVSNAAGASRCQPNANYYRIGSGELQRDNRFASRS